MTTTYTWDVFSSLDGSGGFDEHGDWGGYWGTDGPEFLARRLVQSTEPYRLVLGATTFGMFTSMVGLSVAPELDPINEAMRAAPATVISRSLEGPQDWPDATIAAGDAVEIVARLKAESELPLRSHGSLSLNRALMAAGLVDLVRLTVFPAIAGRTGDDPVFRGPGADDFDIEVVESAVLDGRIHELVLRPSLRHGAAG